MKRTKKLLSFFLAIMMVITTIPAFTLTTNAATNEVTRSVTVSDYGVLSNGGRISNKGYFEIVNDGKNGNFSIGILKFNLSNINKSTDVVKTAQYTLQYSCTPTNNNRTDNMQIGFYYPTKNNSNYTLKNNWTATNTGNAKDTIISSTTDSKFSHYGTAVDYFGLKEITRVTSKADGVTRSLTIDLADMMNYFLQTGYTKATLMIMLTGNDGTIDSAPWSDRKVTPSMSAFNVTCIQTTTYSGTTEVDKTAYNNAIKAFTDKMNDSNVYYNMQAAYDAYIALKSSYDLFYYGGSTTMTADKVNNNIDKLFKTVNNMKPWTQYNTFFKPILTSQLFAGDASGIYGEAYKDKYVNTLYVAGPVDDINSSKTDYMTIIWNMPYAVGLYTGSTIKVPVMTGIKAATEYGWGKPNGYMYTNYLVNNYSNQINYTSDWNYRSGIGSKHFSYSTIQPERTAAVSKTKRNPNGYNYYCGYGNDPRWAYNTVSINPTGFNANNYQEFTSIDLYCRASRTSGLATSETSGNLISVTGASVGYYIIDYRPVTNNLTTAKNKIKSGIVNFDSDNFDMANLMGSVDKLTSVNNTIENTFPLTASGVSKTDCQSKAKSVANTITSNVSEFTTNNNNTAADATKTTAYNNLRSAMDSARANYLLGADELKKTYTTNSVNAFITAYNNAKSIMSKVGTLDDNYGHNASDTNAKATALNNARLVAKANFNAYDQAMETATTVDGYLKSYTTKTPNLIPTHSLLSQYNGITIYKDKDNIPATRQNEISDVTDTLGTLNAKIYNCEQFIDQTALKAFIDKNFDLDVVDNSNITTQKNAANGLYQSVDFNGNKYWSLNVADQAELDSNIAGYINSINSTLGKYDIKVPEGISVAVSGQTQTPTSTTDGISTYRLTYGVPITFTSSNADTAWYMEYQSNVAQRGVQYQCSGETYATKVMGNMTITAKSNSDSNTPNKVTVVRQYSDGSSSAMLIDYVNGSYVLPTAQTYPNYTFTGYEVAPGSRATIENGTVTGITGDTIIYAKYTPANGEHRIIVKDTNGTTITDSNYKYNSAVKLNDPNAYAWIERRINSNDTWRPSYIGTGCSYKVTEPMELMAVKTEAEMKQYCGTKEAYAPNLRYNGPLVANGMGVVFHGQFINYVPAGAQIVEYGVAVNVNNANSFDLINTNGKVIRCKSTNPMKSNQFSVGARYNGDTFTSSTTISYRSYMIYQITVNGQLETRYAYSDVRTFNPNA